MTDEEARTLYRQGEDAVVAILIDLFRRVQVLEEQVAKNSGNSSKPPSSDGLSKAALKPMPQSLREKTGKKPGGQKGQTGKTLLQVEQPDEIVLHRPLSCPHCQTSLQDAPPRAYSRRQLFEMPEPKIVVTEHRREIVNCPCCGNESGGTFPVGIDHPVQYGPRLLGFATYLLGFATYLDSVHLLPFARCAQILRDITLAPFSVGSLSQALATAFTRLETFDTQLDETLAQVSHKHADETGSRIAGKLQWIHVRCNKTLCRLFRHTNRGCVAINDLTRYGGTLMSDFYSSYVRLGCSHQFCGAHLLRELTFAQEVLGQNWAGSLKSVIEQMVACCHRARAEGAVSVESAEALRSAFDDWVEQGLARNPLPPPKRGSRGRPAKGKIRCLLERLRDFRSEYLACLFDLSLPFTNNEAERDLRMLKIKGKISGCFRTGTGADVFCRLRSYILTCQKQGMRLLDCLYSVFIGNPEMPDFSHA